MILLARDIIISFFFFYLLYSWIYTMWGRENIFFYSDFGAWSNHIPIHNDIVSSSILLWLFIERERRDKIYEAKDVLSRFFSQRVIYCVNTFILRFVFIFVGHASHSYERTIGPNPIVWLVAFEPRWYALSVSNACVYTNLCVRALFKDFSIWLLYNPKILYYIWYEYYDYYMFIIMIILWESYIDIMYII